MRFDNIVSKIASQPYLIQLGFTSKHHHSPLSPDMQTASQKTTYARIQFSFSDIAGRIYTTLSRFDTTYSGNEVLCIYVRKGPYGFIEHLYTSIPLLDSILGKEIVDLVASGEETIVCNITYKRKVHSIIDVFRNHLVAEENTKSLEEAEGFITNIMDKMVRKYTRYMKLCQEDKFKYESSVSIRSFEFQTALYIIEDDFDDQMRCFENIWGRYYFKKQKRARERKTENEKVSKKKSKN